MVSEWKKVDYSEYKRTLQSHEIIGAMCKIFFYSDLFIYYDKCNCNACNKKSCKYRIFCFFGNYYFRVLCDILNFGVSKRSSNISKRMHNSMKMEKKCYNKYLCSKISNY